MPEEQVQAHTEDSLRKVVEEIEELLESDQESPEIKETDLELNTAMHTAVPATILMDVGPNQHMSVATPIGRTRGGKIIFPAAAEKAVRRGNKVKANGEVGTILHIEPRYVGPKLTYFVCDVEQDDA